jgi:hypothetical protein
MRLYDYRCPACGAVEERLVKSPGSLQQCSACEYPGSMTRLMPGPRTTFEFADLRRSHEHKAEGY